MIFLLACYVGLRYILRTLSRPLNTLKRIHFVSLFTLFELSNLIMVYSSQVSYDLRGYKRNLSNCVLKPEKVRT